MVPLDDRTDEELYRGYDNFQRHYNRAGFFMKQIHCDGEFKSIMDEVADNLDISKNYANTDDHVTIIEQNN